MIGKSTDIITTNMSVRKNSTRRGRESMWQERELLRKLQPSRRNRKSKSRRRQFRKKSQLRNLRILQRLKHCGAHTQGRKIKEMPTRSIKLDSMTAGLKKNCLQLLPHMQRNARGIGQMKNTSSMQAHFLVKPRRLLII